MVRGGTIIDVVVVSEHQMWVNTFGKDTVLLESTMPMMIDPQDESVEVGDGLWWTDESKVVYWTPRNREDRRTNIALPKVDAPLHHPHTNEFRNTIRVKE